MAAACLKGLIPCWMGASVSMLAIVDTPALALAQARVAETVEVRSAPFGTAARFELLAASFRYDWVIGAERHAPDLEPEYHVMYLWASDGEGHPIDGFVEQSPNGRYAAIVEAGHLVVFDGKSQERVDLTSMGAVFDFGRSPLPQKPVAFSFGNVVVFRRAQADTFQLVALQLETRQSFTLLQTPEEIVGFAFDRNERALIVMQRAARRTLTNDTVYNTESATVDGPRGERQPEQHLHVTRIPTAPLDDREEREEALTAGPPGCFEDGRAAIVHSSMGGWLVGSRGHHGWFGPVQWVTSLEPPSERNCLPKAVRRTPSPSITRGPYPTGAVGLNAAIGYWHFDLDSLNRAMSRQRYTSSSSSHPVFGGELFLASERYRGTFSAFGVNSKNVSLVDDPSTTSALYGFSLGLSVAYSVAKIGRLTLMPEIGTKVLALEVEFPGQAPPLALPAGTQISGAAGLESVAWLLGAGLRLETNALQLGDAEHPTYLTIGDYFGWEQQLLGGDWNLMQGDRLQGSEVGPTLNRSGPLMVFYVGIVRERY